MKIRFAAISDMGRVRKNNEDASLAEPDLGVFAVADGMGGHASGEVASRMALAALREFFRQTGKEEDATLRLGLVETQDSPLQFLAQGIRQANQQIYQASQDKNEYRGMGTTLVAVAFCAPAIVANVGDSRLYRIRDPAIEQITEDHSLVWEEYKKGLLTKEEISSAHHKNIVTRALGIHPSVEVDVKPLDLDPGDLLLLCTDGLSDLVREEEMLRVIVESAGDLEKAGQELVRLANHRGGKDNITVLLIETTDS
jgi:serine/threonine protein phosphatase PrpC